MVLVIDNYDSFTYNLVQALGQMGEEVRVLRNDDPSLQALETLAPKAIIISPGPSRPEKAGLTLDVILRYSGIFSILGICLGHQAIGQAFGAKVVRAKKAMHGKTSPIFHDGRTVFRSIPNPFEGGRYHSLVLERESIPEVFQVSAWTEDGEVMAIRHQGYPMEGLQFHPESILTPVGKRILRNFLEQLPKEATT